MDFIEAKHAAAREIALALGVPPMLLGIPGDNTYFQPAGGDARLAAARAHACSQAAVAQGAASGNAGGGGA
jgi:hypothetical protein